MLFAFDPRREAIFLVAGDKFGNWDGWYRKAVPLADERFAHLAELEAEEEEAEEAMSDSYSEWSDVKARGRAADPRTGDEQAHGKAAARERREAYVRPGPRRFWCRRGAGLRLGSRRKH